MAIVTNGGRKRTPKPLTPASPWGDVYSQWLNRKPTPSFTGVIGGRPEISGAIPRFTPPQIWPPTGMWEEEPEDFYTGARAWWRDIDEWAAEQVMFGYPFAQPAPAQWTPPGYPGGGGGGGGGGPGGIPALPEPRFTLRDILENLQFPKQMEYPSYLRDLGRYIEDLLTQNPQFAIPTPELEDGKLLPGAEDLDTLDYMETAQTFAAAWNEFLQLLTDLPFFQQQDYLGLRYGPDTGWWQSGQVPTLPHPEYL